MFAGQEEHIMPMSASNLQDPMTGGQMGMNAPYEHLQSNLSSESLGQPYPSDISQMSSNYMPSPLSSVANKKRRSSKGGMPSVVKRSASTPNVRGQAASDASAMSAAEKRRNKLGYHRTSVACGHCRRRKIRCLLAPDDHSQRCSNCIRLKKECNFFPVDQQPPIPEHRKRNDSRAGGSSGSSSPSPGLSQSQTFDSVSDFNNFSPATSAGPAEFAVPEVRQHRKGSVSSIHAKNSRIQSQGLPHMHTSSIPRNFEASDSLSRSGYDAHSADGSATTSTWNSPFIDQSPASASKPGFEDPSSNFWRLAESPMTPALSTFAGTPSMPAHDHGAAGQAAARSAYPIDGSREDVGWPLPPRSMSFGNVEGLTQQYPSGHFPYREDFKTPPNGAGGVFPPPIITSGQLGSSGPVSSAPLSAPVDSRPLPSNYGPPPQWSAGYVGSSNIADVPRKAASGFNGWYGEPGPLAQVVEEAGGPHYGEDQPVFYPQATAQTRG